jgi:hypothetical protein
VIATIAPLASSGAMRGLERAASILFYTSGKPQKKKREGACAPPQDQHRLSAIEGPATSARYAR